MINKLFMLLLGCRPAGRNTEQHDIFFGIGASPKDLIPAIKKSWPEAKGNIHIDAWKAVTNVNGYRIEVEAAGQVASARKDEPLLFFINLGGYRENEFDEFHYRLLLVADSMEAAKVRARQTAFYKHVKLDKSANHPNAGAHIDDKYGVDVDDAYKLDDILPLCFKEKFRLNICPPQHPLPNDELHLGYFRLADL
jgi:hypothetical protein